jgi:hypothetical protein
MSRGRHRFRQSDVSKAVRGAIAAGLEVAGVEVDGDGRIRVIVGSPPTAPDRHANEWDSVYEPPSA